MHKIGVSVSPNRVLEISSQLCRMAVERSKEKGVVCPSNLHHNLFTVAAMDNIDHRTTSTTSVDEFHGTGISVFQLPVSLDEGLEQRFQTSFLDVSHSSNRGVPDLPDFYKQLPDCILTQHRPSCEACYEDGYERMLNVGA